MINEFHRAYYLEHQGTVCPYCFTKKIEKTSGYFEDCFRVKQEARCLKCNRMWLEIFKLSDISELKS